MSQIPQKPTKYYFKSVDGLRLLASVNIVLFHLELMGGLNDFQGSPGWLFAIIKGPAFHASLFFILSGFIYTAKFTANVASFNVQKFLKKRITTLVPLHFIMTLTMVPLIIIETLKVGQIPYGKLLASIGLHLSMLWSFYPTGTFSLNTPSWALSAFFFCFVIFGPMLKFVATLTRRRSILFYMFLSICIMGVWSLLYAQYATENSYMFFHVFAPMRAIEFFIGMLLAQLFHCNSHKTRTFSITSIPYLNDIIVALLIVAIYLNVRYIGSKGSFVQFTSYHFLSIPLFAALIYRVARGNGFIAGLFSLKLIRQVGVSSFYPYLIHVPLAGWIGWFCQDILGYRHFFHSGINIALFMIILYGTSALIWRNRRGKLPDKST